MKSCPACNGSGIVQAFYVVKDEGDGALAYWSFPTEAEARTHPFAKDDLAVVIAIPSAYGKEAA